MNAHLDVIPGKEGQYIPRMKGSRLYGVGSLDMKGGAACLIAVFREVARMVDYQLGLQLTTDEEIGGFNGTKYQISKGVRADFAITAEPTNLEVVNEAKGVTWMKISCRGTTAHSAYPWRGENAIWKMNEFLNVLKRKYPVPQREKWTTTVNVSKIETDNQSFNKIPSDCAILLDIRSTPKEAGSVVRDIKGLLPKGFAVEVVVKEPAFKTPAHNKYVEKLRMVGEAVSGGKIALRGAHGSSDVRHFTSVHCPGIEFGPAGGGIGSDNEWVDVRSLATYRKILREFLLSL